MIPKGFRFAGVRCGLKNKRNDIGLLISDLPARAAGVFTQNQSRASCVEFSREALASGDLRGIVVNSGNANCCTGDQGRRDTGRMAMLAADALNVPPGSVAVASTGVIGKMLDMPKVGKGILDASTKLGDDPRPFMDAILTTDLVEKWAYAGLASDRLIFSDPKIEPTPWLEGVDPVPVAAVNTLNMFSPAGPALASSVTTPRVQLDGMIYGVCKGSGMIGPNMATMLAFIVTDFDVSEIDLHEALVSANEPSFNSLTVDGDTSTNDMVILMANGASGVKPSPDHFHRALHAVCTSLAKQVARDGEGATKLVEVRVRGTSDPKRIARAVADSPLVKTAMFGCDPNWGRIMMAAGHAGVPFDPEAVTLSVIAGGESHVLFEAGSPGNYDVKRVSSALKSDHVKIHLDFGEGAWARIFTCDFGYGYVRINAEYHT